MNYKATMMNATALPASIPANPGRRYIAVVASTAVTVIISGGTSFPLAAGAIWAPIPACSNDIAFTGTGTLILG